MNLLQPSFTKGEISPLLHARVDLAAYATGLRTLKNFIVLPQGGVARRPGFLAMGPAAVPVSPTCPVRLIPFRYNSEDAMIVELSDRKARFWTSGGIVMKDGVPYEIEMPYTQADLPRLKFVQSGNVLFLVHRDYPPLTLTRKALDDWETAPLVFREGPWLPTEGKDTDVYITVTEEDGDEYVLTPTDPDFFTAAMEGALFRLDYTLPGEEVRGVGPRAPEWGESTPVEVGGDWYFETHGGWTGEVQIQKSLDGGETWLTVRTYSREDYEKEGQLQTSGAETEKNVLYRIRAQKTNDNTLRWNLNISGYIKSYIFRLKELQPDGSMIATRLHDDTYLPGVPYPLDVQTKQWFLGAWGVHTGYPGCVVFYQDRLVLAGSHREPQTIWFSKVADWRNFGMSDPIRDDDAITITLAADDMDGIHSLAAMSDVMVFTPSGEWKIAGAGENGAISAKAVVAHQQTTVGSRYLQPVIVNHRIVFAQTHGTEVHALGYSLDVDGYSGSDISILSRHLFEWKVKEDERAGGREIVAMDYQQIPDSLIWCVLADGTAVTCTYQAEHETVAWARQETEGRIGDVACIPGQRHTQLWAAVERNGASGLPEWGIERLAPREDELVFHDAGIYVYDSLLETLRITYDGQRGASMPDKKLIARLAVYAIRSTSALICPATDTARDRERGITWEWAPAMTENEIQLDNGFERDAGVAIRTVGAESLTIVAISPKFTPGG